MVINNYQDEEQRRERTRQRIIDHHLKQTKIDFVQARETAKHPPSPGEAPELWYFCPEHGDVEAPYFVPNVYGGRWFRRHECQDALAQRKQAAFKQQQQDERLKEYRRCYQGFLGDEYYDERAMLYAMTQTFAVFDHTRAEEAYDSMVDMTQERSGSVIITGGKGSGKTHLANALCNFHLERNRRLAPEEALHRCRPIIAPASVLYRAFNQAQFTDDTDISAQSLISIMSKAHVMVIDDLDKLARRVYSESENPTLMQTSPAFQEFMQIIVDARYRARLLTIITCNDAEQLWSYIGEYALSRLEWNQHLIANNAPDYRPLEK